MARTNEGGLVEQGGLNEDVRRSRLLVSRRRALSLGGTIGLVPARRVRRHQYQERRAERSTLRHVVCAAGAVLDGRGRHRGGVGCGPDLHDIAGADAGSVLVRRGQHPVRHPRAAARKRAAARAARAGRVRMLIGQQGDARAQQCRGDLALRRRWAVQRLRVRLHGRRRRAQPSWCRHDFRRVVCVG